MVSDVGITISVVCPESVVVVVDIGITISVVCPESVVVVEVGITTSVVP